MIQLPNNCSCSEISVNPKNWEKPGASLLKDWYIQYYFHDPAFKHEKKYRYGKLVLVKGMNSYKTLSERRAATKKLIECEMHFLKFEGYNPILGRRVAPIEIAGAINPQTPFINALRQASEKLKVTATTASDIRSVIKGFEQAASELRLVVLPISDIRRKHLKAVLEHMQRNNPRCSAHRFNKYRSYLMILFKELVEVEAIEINPVRDISKQKTLTKLRKLLTPEERQKIDVHLKNNCYTFWRYLQIFFHSGCRETELMKLQAKHIELGRQRYKVIVKKGRSYREDWRPIKDVVLSLWQNLLQAAAPDDFIFSVGLIPGNKSIRPDQITRRWRTHVKDKLGIEADFYSLKHLNIDETAAALSLQDASAMAGHATTVITMKHYAQGEKDRQQERLKKVNNSFAGH